MISFPRLRLPKYLLFRALYWLSAVPLFVLLYFASDRALERIVEQPHEITRQEIARLQEAVAEVHEEMSQDGQRLADFFVQRGYIDFEQHLDAFHLADGSPYPLAIYILGGGKILEAYLRPRAGIPSKISGAELSRYQPLFSQTFAHTVTPPPIPPALIVLRGVPFFVSVTPVCMKGELWPNAYIVLGREIGSLAARRLSSEASNFFEVFPAERLVAIGPAQSPCPLFQGSEADTYQGVWGFVSDCFETILPLYDMTGLPVARYTMRLPEGIPVLVARLKRSLPCLAAGCFFALAFLLSTLIRWGVVRPLNLMLAHLRTIREDEVSGITHYIHWREGKLFSQLVDEINRLLGAIARRSAQTAQVERSLRFILNNIPDGLAVFDRDGRLLQLRKQPEGVPPIPGLTEGECLSEKHFDATGRTTFRDTCNTVLNRAEQAVIRLACRAPNAATRYLETRFTKLGNETVLVIFTDISRRVQEAQRRILAEIRLRQSQQRHQINDLSRFLAHDINNTMTVIRSVLEITNPNDPGSVHSALNSLRSACEKGTLLARDLMDSSGAIQLKCTSEHPAVLLNALATFYENALPDDVSLQIDPVPAGTHPVVVDPVNFWRILSNLTRNASEALHAHGGGTIRLWVRNFNLTHADPSRAVVWPAGFADGEASPRADGGGCTRKGGEGVLFELSDNGPGIPEALQERLFEPAVSTKGGMHRGFGMAIVRALVEAHGGALAFRSIQGRGTAFRVWMPASTELPAPALDQPAVPYSPQHAEQTLRALQTADQAPRGFACLIVDDEAAIRTAIKALLEHSFAADVAVAASAEEALDAAQAHPGTEVVFLDAHLGQQTSQQLCQLLRERLPKAKLVITSGLARDHIRFLFQAQKPDAILPKPFTLADLRTLLISLLAAPAAHPQQGALCPKF